MDSPQRPRSFQSSSPVMIQTTAASPGSPGASLHRSIANMHIGSPPNASRRYSPYSPRLSSSPKPVHQDYSSSVPLTHVELSSSPVNTTNNIINNTNNNMMLSSSYSAKSCRYYNNPKTYKPFMSSALATPDREEDVNPFDSYYAQENNTPIKEENIDYFKDLGYGGDNSGDGGGGGGDGGGGGGGGCGGGDSSYMNNNFIDPNWMNSNAFELLLQQQQQEQQLLQQQQQEEQLQQQQDNQFLSNEQILAMINTQQQQSSFDFKLDDSSFNQSSYYHH
ncbi:hypothetical protein BD770DRAFT_394154 [Pilaira anomala]|nr:hypothetical protein BD770DRAFT_394154 [Pilaira anomala]